MFRKILVAVDGSKNSRLALDRAIALAKGQRADVLGIVHVRPTIETWSRLYGYHVATSVDVHLEMLKSLEEGAQKLLAESAEKAREALPETRVEVYDEAGVVVSRIVDVVREGDYGVLVVGSRGMGRAAGLLLGSVSQALLAKLPCSILVVRADEAEDGAHADGDGVDAVAEAGN